MAINAISLAPIDRYLTALWERGGSDLLLTAFSPPLMRVDGQLIPIPGEPDARRRTTSSTSCSSVLTEDLEVELRTDREVDFSFSYNEGRPLPRATASSRWARSRCRCA